MNNAHVVSNHNKMADLDLGEDAMNAGSVGDMPSTPTLAYPSDHATPEVSVFDTMNSPVKGSSQGLTFDVPVPSMDELEFPIVDDLKYAMSSQQMEGGGRSSVPMTDNSQGSMPSSSTSDLMSSGADQPSSLMPKQKSKMVQATMMMNSNLKTLDTATPSTPSQHNTNTEDGMGMADMSGVHPETKSEESSNRQLGFMDVGDMSEPDIAGQMNDGHVTGLDMMRENDDISLLMLGQYYNQYATQTAQPEPLAPPQNAEEMNQSLHPYGMPYFHRDPFMPLQTPYYHIPTFDNPQKNAALTPYYNPYVNPPPPIPPSVPAAPSFFPFHHPQHMIPPYFPYPAAPVIQPGPFPPYALASHIAPGKLAPDSKTSKLPEIDNQDPF